MEFYSFRCSERCDAQPHMRSTRECFCVGSYSDGEMRALAKLSHSICFAEVFRSY